MGGDTVRLAVVGLGAWGKNVVRSFAGASHASLVCLCDRRARILDHHRRLYPEATVTDDYRSVLRDPQIDAVALATPAPLHYEMAAAALEGALACHPDYPDAHYHLAKTLDRLGRPRPACDHWQAFLRLAPESPWANQARTRLQDED